jgi:hypothetical protein
MTSDELDPLIHVPTRLKIVATLAALPDGDALSFTRLQDMIRLTPGSLITCLRELGRAEPLHHRAAAAAALGEHFAHGRLTLDELHARLDATLTATTHGQLSQAVQDLPDPTAFPAGSAFPSRFRAPSPDPPSGPPPSRFVPS